MRHEHPHIAAKPGQIAPYVLMPGDPLRAKWIAETFLEDTEVYSEVRGMLELHRHLPRRARLAGLGDGLPSFSIYAHELFAEYDVQAVVRVAPAAR